MNIETLKSDLRQCDLCARAPQYGPPLPHAARPIFQFSARSKVVIASQAPGNKAHQKGLPFYDPSGRRLRAWLDVDEATFYNPDNFAIVPMGFCFPGYDKNGGDLPPRRECATLWREAVFAQLPEVQLILAIGQYAQKYHLDADAQKRTLTQNVKEWRTIFGHSSTPKILPLPHPSWRNNAWLNKNPWFAQELLPALQGLIRGILLKNML